MPLSKIHKIPTSSYVAFFSTLIGGYLFHLYAFTNLIPNSDGLHRMYDYQEMTVSGRWFLHYATFPNGFVQMPAFIGLVTLLFLGLSMVLIIDLLEIKFKPFIVALSIAFVSFPSLGFTFLYLFTASAYSVGIFLAILSVWFGNKGGEYTVVAVIALGFSMGIYQAYAAFAIGLSVILVIKKSLCPQENQKSVTKAGLNFLVYLSLGAVLYYVMLQVSLRITGQELLSYLGMEQNVYPFATLPHLIFLAYKQVISFFFMTGVGTTNLFLCACNLTVILLGVLGLFYIAQFYWKSKEYWRLVYTVLLCCILPLALGFAQIISPWSAPTPLMQYPYVLAYAIVLFFVDNGLLMCPISWKRNYGHGVLATFFLISASSGWMCNLLYVASAQAHRATESYVTRILTQIQMTEGYQWGMPVYVIGAFPEDRFYSDLEIFQLMDHYSAPVNSVLPLNKHIYYYFHTWLHVPIEEPSESDFISMAESKEFQGMPLYPDWGSVQKIGDSIVVKIEETYTPKSDYELEYEAKESRAYLWSVLPFLMGGILVYLGKKPKTQEKP